MKAGLTIEELAAEIMRQKEAKADYVVNTESLRMEPCGTELVLRVLDENNADRIEPLDISEQAHRQIGTHLSIPAKYYNRMLTEYPELLAKNVNAWFEREATPRMLRVLDGRMRAFVSNRYLRIDHHEVSCAAMPVVGEMPDIHFVSCQITDSRMYIKLVNPHMQEEIAPGITVQSGLLISNSEVGLGSVSVQPLIYYPEFDAGMIVRTSSTKRVHSGPVYSVDENFHIPPEQSYLQDGSPFLERIRDTVRDAVDEQMFEQTADRIREAREAHFDADHVLDVVQAAGHEFGVTESEQDGVLEQLVTDNDMSLYGLANAVTRHSQRIENYDRATVLEEIGYDILSMTSARWNRINQAAAAIKKIKFMEERIMPYNNENTLMENGTNFLLPDMMPTDDVFSEEELTEEFAGLQPNFQRVKIPGGGTQQFELPGEDPDNPDYARTIEGVIVYHHPACAYWPAGSEYDENISPYCSSVDGVTGIGDPGGACAVCELNKYGTDVKGKGKACKNMRQLYILRSGEYLPVLLSLPPTSLTPFNDFMNAACIARRRPAWSFIVQIGLKRVDNGSNTYSVATFRKVADFTGEDIAKIKQYASSFREQIRLMNQQRAVEAETRSDTTAYGTESGYTVAENDGHFCISGNEVVDGDRDELPL